MTTTLWIFDRECSNAASFLETKVYTPYEWRIRSFISICDEYKRDDIYRDIGFYLCSMQSHTVSKCSPKMPQIVAVNSKGGRDKEIGPWGPSPAMGVAGPWGYWVCGCRERGFFPFSSF